MAFNPINICTASKGACAAFHLYFHFKHAPNVIIVFYAHFIACILCSCNSKVKLLLINCRFCFIAVLFVYIIYIYIYLLVCCGINSCAIIKNGASIALPKQPVASSLDYILALT